MSTSSLQRGIVACLLLGVILIVSAGKKSSLSTSTSVFATTSSGIMTDSYSPDTLDIFVPHRGALIRPLYPIKTRGPFVIQVEACEPDSVVLTLEHSPGVVEKELLNRRLDAGHYFIQSDFSDLPEAAYRISMTKIGLVDTLVCFSEVQIIP